jgi:ABC-type lipoprotein export system ATPase subunit
MIKLQNLHMYYQSGEQSLHVLKGIDLHIRAGELVSVMGSSGSGKSTLLNVLGILDGYDRGSYRLANQEIRNLKEAAAARLRNRLLGFVFQSFNLLPFKTPTENVALPLYYQGGSRKERNHRAERLVGAQPTRGSIHEDGGNIRTSIVGAAARETHDREPNGGADRVRESPRVGSSPGVGVRRRRL